MAWFEQPARELCNGLLRLERTIARAGGPWALGEFSFVDVTMMACFHRFEDVCLDVVLQEPALDHLWRYWERLQGRASYKSAVTDWHDAETWRPIVAELFGSGKSPHQDLVRKTLAELA